MRLLGDHTYIRMSPLEAIDNKMETKSRAYRRNVNRNKKSKISSRFDYFPWSMRWGNVSIESDLRCIKTH